MCGRFVMIADLSTITEVFEIQEVSGDITPSYNIAPGSIIDAITSEGSKRIVQFKWGLIPSWAQDPSMSNRLINARAETITEKPSFRTAVKKRRCLIIASGFYEWHTTAKGKIPVYIRLKSGRPFGFAGLYEIWRSPENEEIRTCAIITTGANDLIQPVHNRMPVIVHHDMENRWLDSGIEDTSPLTALFKPYPHEEMEAYAVSPFVNSPRNDSPECIRPAPANVLKK